jgi:PAS domain S-box-containing protein
MQPQARLPDRLNALLAAKTWRAARAQSALFLSPSTPEEHDRRRAHLAALLLVAIVATAKHVTGLTESSAPYTVYGLAIAVSAFVGGFWPACVATMASVLLADAAAQAGIGSSGIIAFALEGFGVAALVSTISGRLRDTEAQLAALNATSHELRAQVRDGQLAQRALEHLEDMTPDAAVFVVNTQGMIVDWSRSAERMYGYTAEQATGSNFATIVGDPSSAANLGTALSANAEPARSRPTGVHRRFDGTRMHVELDVRRGPSPTAEHLTVAVYDLSRRRETDDFREAALRAQAALQQAADDTRAQLAVLESLTDPSVNPVGGSTAIAELLDRLRSGIGADGLALVQLGRTATRVVAGAGLRPAQVRAAGAVAIGGATEGRVALVHNDPSRVAQVSALTWPASVSSIMVVPVWQTGPATFRMEIVNERRAPATEWDLALARIVADRLAQAMAHMAADSANAVA